MRVVTAAEMRALDRATIERGTPSLDLMERAGRGAALAIARRVDAGGTAGPGAIGGCGVAVVCGAGNNGGDGFVVARHLAARGARVAIYLGAAPEKLSRDARVNFDEIVPLAVPVHDVATTARLRAHAGAIARADVVVDALFGTGLDRELSAHARELVATMNRSRGLKVAVDLPSGMHADTGEALGAAFAADVTVTFAFPKLALVSHPGFARAGDVEVVDIGIPDALAAELGVRLDLVEEARVREALPARPASGHKGTFGHVLCVAGSRDKPGAALLAAGGAMRAGAGLCTVASTAAGRQAIASRVLETMTASYADADEPAPSDLPRLLDLARGKEAVAVGPGIPTGNGMREIVGGLVREVESPLVLDADALNLLAGRTGVLRGAKAPVAVTPHPGEMARLCGRTVAEVQADRVGIARRFAAETGAHVALKGARTVVAAPDGRAWINPTGNPGMATGGAGDVLCGMVAALLAQDVALPEALWVAVFVHGAAGDRAAARRGRMGLLARDLLGDVPSVLRDLGG